MLYLLTALAFAADADGDGFADSVDCDDSNASVYPGAVESCDGLDTDCDGVTPQTEQDQDGDGYVACGAGWSDCSDYVATDTANAVWESTWRLVDSLGVMVDPAGNAVVGGCDCRDESGGELTSPGVVETCGVTPLEDNDCDGDFYTAKGGPWPRPTATTTAIAHSNPPSPARVRWRSGVGTVRPLRSVSPRADCSTLRLARRVTAAMSRVTAMTWRAPPILGLRRSSETGWTKTAMGKTPRSRRPGIPESARPVTQARLRPR